MASKKREIGIFLIVLTACAVWIASRADFTTSAPPPHQLVLETRYSLPWQDEIALRRGEEELFVLPEMYRWDSGAHGRQVVAALGEPPLYTVGFLDEDYYLWEVPVRYDWDEKREYEGRYLAVAFYSWGRVRSVSLYQELPADARECEAGRWSREQSGWRNSDL